MNSLPPTRSSTSRPPLRRVPASDDPAAPSLIRSLHQLLDDVQRGLSDRRCHPPAIAAAIDRLFQGLSLLRQASPPKTWNRLIETGRAHPIIELLHEDPFTGRAYHKPRGYAGDAVMMDYIYAREETWPPPPASPLGAAIFDYTTAAPASAGVRERRSYIADLLDRFSCGRVAPDVLAVAAGHLREASLSTALRRGRFGRFLALDADSESLAEIEQQYAGYGVEPVAANIRRLLTGRLQLGNFDLIYSTGLYDYLAATSGQRLTANLFQQLRPGGRLVIANFLPQIPDVGYMEMFMDWHLVYRDRRELLGLAAKIEPAALAEIRIVAEPNDNVAILELAKRRGSDRTW